MKDQLKVSYCKNFSFFLTFFVPGSRTGSALRPRFLLFVQYWQDAGIRTRVELGGDE